MIRWLAPFRLESKLLWSNWLFAALPPLYMLWMLLSVTQISRQSQDVYMNMLENNYLSQSISLGAAMMVGIMLLRRDVKQSAYEWMMSLPVTPAAYVFSKFAAGFLYLSTFSAGMLIAYTYAAFRYGLPIELLPGQAWQAFIQYEWSYGVTLALAMLLGAVLPGRISFIIGFCAWMFGTFFMELYIITSSGLYPLKTFHLNQFFSESYMAHELWGPYFSAEELKFSRVFVAAFALLLLTVIIAVLNAAKSVRASRIWLSASTAMFVLTGAAFAPYALLWNERYSAMDAIFEDAPILSGNAKNQSLVTFPVEAYDIRMERSPDDKLSVVADMTIRHADIPKGTSRLPFTLNRSFAVAQVLVDGAKVDFTRRNDLLELDKKLFHSQAKASGKHIVSIHYSGKLLVRTWNSGGGYNEKLLAFVSGGNVWLPSTIGWYPLAGNEPIYVRRFPNSFEINENRKTTKPASFRIAASGFADKLYASIDTAPETEASSANDAQYRFADPGVTDVTLLGGKYIEVSIPGESLKIITTPSNRQQVERFLKDVSELKAYYKEWLNVPLDRYKQIFFFPMNMLFSSAYNIEKLTGNSYFISEYKYLTFYGFQRTLVMNALLFGDLAVGQTYSSEPGKRKSYAGEIRDAFYYLYVLEHMDKRTESEISMPTTNGFSSDKVGKPIYSAIGQAVNTGRSEQAKQVLKYFYDKGLHVDWESNPISYEESNPPAYPKISLQEWKAAWQQFNTK